MHVFNNSPVSLSLQKSSHKTVPQAREIAGEQAHSKRHLQAQPTAPDIEPGGVPQCHPEVCTQECGLFIPWDVVQVDLNTQML